MPPIDKKQTLELLRQSGIPDLAIRSNLEKEKQGTLRYFLQSKSFVHDGGWRGAYLYPKTNKDIVTARRAFFVAAKEAVLLGHSISVFSLPRLIEAMFGEDDYGNNFSDLEARPMLWVSGFYEEGAPFPLEPWQAAKLRSWAIERYESKRPISWLSDKPLAGTGAWWNGSFLSLLDEHVVSFSVGG